MHGSLCCLSVAPNVAKMSIFTCANKAIANTKQQQLKMISICTVLWFSLNMFNLPISPNGTKNFTGTKKANVNIKLQQPKNDVCC